MEITNDPPNIKDYENYLKRKGYEQVKDEKTGEYKPTKFMSHGKEVNIDPNGVLDVKIHNTRIVRTL